MSDRTKRSAVELLAKSTALGIVLALGATACGDKEVGASNNVVTEAAGPEGNVGGEAPSESPEVDYAFNEVITYEPGAFASMAEQEQYDAINEGLMVQANDYLNACIYALQNGQDMADIPVSTFADGQNAAVLAIQTLAEQMVSNGPAGATIANHDASVAIISSENAANMGLPEMVSQVIYDENGVIQSSIAGGVTYTIDGVRDDNTTWLSVPYEGVEVTQSAEGNLQFSTVK